MTPSEFRTAGQPAACAFPVPALPELPEEVEPWLREWAERTRREVEVLALNGAAPQAIAVGRAYVCLVEAAQAWLDAELSVADAAALAGCCEETVRRAVRSGDLPDRRPGGRGRHRVRRGDLATAAPGYDPAGDALALAARRRNP